MKDALRNLKFRMLIKYTMKMCEMKEKLAVSVIDGRSKIDELGYKIMVTEARLSKIALELQGEKDPVKIAELREEEKDLNLVLAETIKEQSKEKRKVHMLSKLDAFVSKMDEKKLKKANALYEKLKMENEEEFKRTQEYNKLLSSSAKVKSSDLGSDDFMKETPEGSFSKACDELVAMLESNKEPTFEEMCDNLMRAYEQGEEAFAVEMGKSNSTKRNVINEAPATEIPATKKLEAEVPVNNSSITEKPKNNVLQEELDEIELQQI